MVGEPQDAWKNATRSAALRGCSAVAYAHACDDMSGFGGSVVPGNGACPSWRCHNPLAGSREPLAWT
eukprot:4380799-Prymnesium_polylepis.1